MWLYYDTAFGAVDLSEDFFEVDQKGNPVSVNNVKSSLSASTGGGKKGKKKK